MARAGCGIPSTQQAHRRLPAKARQTSCGSLQGSQFLVSYRLRSPQRGHQLAGLRRLTWRLRWAARARVPPMAVAHLGVWHRLAGLLQPS